MKKIATNFVHAVQRPAYLFVALAVMVATMATMLPAHAGQVQYRAVRMSDNGASGGSITSGVGSGTNVTYRVFFRAAASYTIRGVVLDFCSGTAGTPFIGDSNCSAPTGFTVGSTPTVDVSDFTESATTTAGLTTPTPTAWTADSLNAGQTFRMTNSEGKALTSGTDYSFSISGITNPSTVGTFYGRLMIYTSNTGSVASYTHSSPGTYQDYGGFALTTAAIVQVTAKVQETLSFCVSGYSSAAYTTAYNTYITANSGDVAGADAAGLAAAAGVAPTSCTDSTPPAIILGHGTNNTIDATQIDSKDVWTIASTNALHGLTIRMRNSNICGGLSTDNGTTCAIPAASSGSATPSAIVAGNAAFGARCFDSTGGTSGTSAISCDPNYISANTTPYDYGMDSTSTGDNVTTTYGDKIAASTAPVNTVTNRYNFAATASNTTPAGIYRSNLAMIATGTF